jgi:hypothetical protein
MADAPWAALSFAGYWLQMRISDDTPELGDIPELYPK